MIRTKDLRNYFWIIVGIGWLMIPFILWILPSTYFDQGESICLSQSLFHQSCYGCGITRAIQHLMHGELDSAMEFNKLSIVVLPVLVFVWIQNLSILLKKAIKR